MRKGKGKHFLLTALTYECISCAVLSLRGTHAPCTFFRFSFLWLSFLLSARRAADRTKGPASSQYSCAIRGCCWRGTGPLGDSGFHSHGYDHLLLGRARGAGPD